MTDTIPTPDWDPLDPETLQDPHGTYARLRQRCPVAHSDRWGGFWALTRYKDVTNAAADARTFISSIQNVVPHVGFGKRIPLHVDPPAHTFYRRVLNPPFDPDKIAAFEPTVRQIVVSLLEPLITKGKGEVVEEFTYYLPVRVLCEFLTIPQKDALHIKNHAERYARALETGDYETVGAESNALYDYARRLVAARKAAPFDPERDTTSALLAARIDGQPIEDEVIVGSVRQLLVAGHLTLTLSLASAVLHLALQPNLQARLRQEPERIPDAIEEILRLYPPTQAFARTTTRQVEIGGRTIKTGDVVALVWIAANRDPDIFPHPDEFDLDRERNQHLAFGHGIHKCLGAPLARMELRVALEELLARTRHFELDDSVADSPVIENAWPEYGPRSLPIRFTT
jgi:cytochrome P450